MESGRPAGDRRHGHLVRDRFNDGLGLPASPDPVLERPDVVLLYLVVVGLLAAFQNAHYHLEETVQRRTSALQTEINERKRLEAAKLQSERLAMVGTMAAQVAHEIRNPLGSITLNLDLIYKEIDRFAENAGNSPDEGRALIKDMRTEVCRILHVLEDYLQFARLPKLQRKSLDLKEFLDQRLAFFNGELTKANVRVCTHFDPALVSIHADPEQLWQALLNLLRNSREAMPGGGEITIGTWRHGGEVLLRVSDNGKGMTEEQRQHLFEPFSANRYRTWRQHRMRKHQRKRQFLHHFSALDGKILNARLGPYFAGGR